MFFGEWIEIVTFKKKPFDVHKENPSLGSALVQLIVAGLIVGVLGAAASYFAAGEMMKTMAGMPPEMAETFKSTMQGVSLMAVVTTPLTYLIGAVIGSFIFHLVSKLFGGKGTFTHFLAVSSVVSAAVSGVLNGFLTLLTVIAAVAGMYMAVIPVLGILSILVFIIGLVLLIKTIKAVEVFETGKAILVFIVSIVLLVVIFFALTLLLGAAIFGSLLGGGALSGMTGQ